MVNVINLNPLTGLPGNREIRKQLQAVIGDAGKVIVYVDIIDFKPYNEVYGFTAGDNVILVLAEILRKACDVHTDKYFFGHIGGDDFVIVIDEKFLSGLYKYIDKEFLIRGKSFYHQPDISRRFIVGWDRNGERVKFPLMGICAAAFSSYRQGFNTVEQISEYATYLKEASKSRRDKDNIFITPKDLNILPVPVKDFVLNNQIPLFKRRTVIEAMGESGFVHHGRILISLLSEDMHSMLKKSVIFALGRLRFTPAEEIILKYVSDSNPHLRTRAVEALGQIGGAKYLAKIGAMILDSNPYVAVMAVKSLGNIGHPDGLKYLRDIPLNSSRWLSLEAAVTRSVLGDKTVVNELGRLIRDTNPLYRKKISIALEIVSSVECVEILCDAIEAERIHRIRNAFTVSLGRIVKNISYGSLKQCDSRLWKIYKNTPANIKPYLFGAIAKCGIKGAKKILEKNLNSSSNLERLFAIEGMVYFNNPGHVYLIRKSLKDNSTRVRARSARAIGEIMDVEGMEFLRRSLKDDDEHVRKRASESILKMATESFNK